MERGNLVVTRKTNEIITIGEGETAIIVTLYRAEAGRAKIGVNAPKDVPVMRGNVKKKGKGAA